VSLSVQAPAAAALWITIAAAGAADAPAWREDFRELPKGAETKGKPGTPAAVFEAADVKEAEDGRALRMTADKASASFFVPVDGVDIGKTPVLRWRWRVTEFPAGPDGRDAAKDDQAIGIYLGTGGLFGKTSLAWRWETDTPVAATGTASYAAGVVKVHWIGLRNRESGADFVVEERNVADVWKAHVGGDLPKSFTLSVSCNSQYTGTKAAAELDWIEFRPATNAAPDRAPHGVP